MLQLLAGADPSTCGAATHVAVGLKPGDRAVEALPVVFVGHSKLGGQARELELVLIDLLAAANQLRGDRLAGPRRSFPGLTLHTESVRTPVWRVNRIGLLIFKAPKQGVLRASLAKPTQSRLQSPDPAQTPSSQSVSASRYPRSGCRGISTS